MDGPITKNADRDALLLMVSFRALLNELIVQHGRLSSYVLANTMMSVAHELLASTSLPQQFASNVPEADTPA